MPEALGICGFLAFAAYLVWLAVARMRSGFWKDKRTERARKKSLSESWQEIRQAPTDTPEQMAASRGVPTNRQLAVSAA